MFIDVAIRSSVLTASLRNQLRALPVCIPQLGGWLSGLVFDHVEIDTPTIERVTNKVSIRLGDGTPNGIINGHRVRFRFSVRIYLATVDDVRKGGINGPSKPFPLHLQVLFDLVGELQTDPNGQVVGAGFRTVYAGKDAALPDQALDDQVETLLQGASRFVPLDLGPLEQVLEKKSLLIHNIGVATDQARSRIVIRAEIDTMSPDPVVTWEAFFSKPPDPLGGRDWALLIDRRLLLQIAVDRVKAALSASKDTKIVEGPSAEWLPNVSPVPPIVPFPPGIRVETSVDLVDACPEVDLDIEVGIELVTRFGLADSASGKELLFSTNIAWDANNWDVILCGLALSFIGAHYGFIIGGASGGPIVAGIGAAVGLVVTVVAVAIIADYVSPPSGKLQQPDCKTLEEDDDHVEIGCRRPLELPESPLLGKLVPDELWGDPLGLLLRGTSSVPDLQKKFFLNVTPMGWEQKLSCNGHRVVTSQVGSVELTVLKVCGLHVVDDPLKYFVPKLKSVGGSTWRIEVGINSAIGLGLPPSDIDNDYRANPYPCRLLLRTSHGARFLDLGVLPEAPPPPDPHKVIKALGIHCFKQYRRFYNELFDPDWVIDVHPGDIVMQHWRVTAGGLPAGSGVELVDREGQRLAWGAASDHGKAYAQAVVSPERGLSIRRTKGGEDVELGEFDPEVHRLAITQRLLIRHRTLFLPGARRALAAFRGVGRWQLVSVTEAGLLVWDQHPVGGLVPVTLLRGVDLRGLAPRPGGFAAFGADGLWAFRAEEDGRARVVGAVKEGDVADAVTVAGRLYVVADGRLDMFATDLAARRSIEVGKVESLYPTADGVAVKLIGATQMTVYGSGPTGDLLELRQVPIEAGAVTEAGRSSPHRLQEPPPHDLGSTDGSRWFAQTIAVTPWLAHLPSDLTTIELYARTPPAEVTTPWREIRRDGYRRRAR